MKGRLAGSIKFEPVWLISFSLNDLLQQDRSRAASAGAASNCRLFLFTEAEKTAPSSKHVRIHACGGGLLVSQREWQTALKRDKRLPLPVPLREIDDLAAEARRHFDFRNLPAAERLSKEILAREPSH